MNKILYTRPDGGVSIVVPAPKESLEQVLGPLTVKEYSEHVYRKSIPEDAINIREIEDTDLPDREFRNAWVDVTEESRIDICCSKARDLKLEEVRAKRKELLVEQDSKFMIALETGKGLDEVKAEKQRLRDITEPLKALDVEGKYNDEEVLASIRQLGDI